MHHDIDLDTKHLYPVAHCLKRSVVCVSSAVPGDSVTFYETVEGKRTNTHLGVDVGYVDYFGCQHGYVNLSLCNVGLLVVGKDVNEKNQ